MAETSLGNIFIVLNTSLRCGMCEGEATWVGLVRVADEGGNLTLTHCFRPDTLLLVS